MVGCLDQNFQESISRFLLKKGTSLVDEQQASQQEGGEMLLRTILTDASRLLWQRRELMVRSHVAEGEVNVTFVTPTGDRVPCTATEGTTILELAHANNVDLEGACEASLACSTCHVILPDDFFSRLPAPTDEELDMLDLAFGLTETYATKRFWFLLSFFP